MRGSRVSFVDYVHSCELALSLSEYPRFSFMYKAMIEITNRFKFPNRRSVVGKYLDNNYQVHQETYKTQLRDHMYIFGLILIGDGTTVKKNASHKHYSF